MTARFLVGDTRDRLGDIPDASVDLVLTSPPFLALRSYLPEDHPDKGREIGSEATPAEFIDVLLELTAGWGRVLAPHGSLAVELGDTYAGSGGAGGDYGDDGLREGQPRFRQADGDRGQPQTAGTGGPLNRGGGIVPLNAGPGWPLAKSLACIPQLYQVALAYGINPLTGRESPAGRWRVRTLKPWIRSNPPVGALGDKERPATSYVIVACRATDRWFDLDAVRTKGSHEPHTDNRGGHRRDGIPGRSGQTMNPVDENGQRIQENAGGAPPRDWWHHVDAILDAELAQRAGKHNGGENPVGSDMGHRGRLGSGDGTNNEGKGRVSEGDRSVGAQGVHLRRALERSGILTTLEALDISPRGYSGAHYAVWPPELVRLLVDEMCPRRVCTTCGEPSRRIVDTGPVLGRGRSNRSLVKQEAIGEANARFRPPDYPDRTTLGWSDCGHNTWRPGHILDPFAGSGTTLAVATGMARTATGIDIDQRNAWLASERVGMFLDIDLGVHADGARIP